MSDGYESVEDVEEVEESEEEPAPKKKRREKKWKVGIVMYQRTASSAGVSEYPLTHIILSCEGS